jgi:hypothetical protein
MRGVLARYDWLSYSAPMRGPAGPRRGGLDDDDPRLSVDLVVYGPDPTVIPCLVSICLD